ncbi:MAG TPA: P-loop NTPase, partial [Candidatus Tectomicrobia bacterium]
MPKRYRDIAGDGGSNVAGQVAAQLARLQARMAGVKHTIAVMSGKGGVGKSTITTNLAMFFALQGWRVGVVDADINGPSLATMFGVRGHQLRLDANSVLPALGPLGVQLMSMDLFLAEDKTPVVWDGPTAETFLWRGTMEMHTLREFLSDVQWGTLDILLLDLPPGAERVSTIRDLLPDLRGTVVVTIPSAVSQLVVLKSIT